MFPPDIRFSGKNIIPPFPRRSELARVLSMVIWNHSHQRLHKRALRLAEARLLPTKRELMRYLQVVLESD